MRMGSGRSGRAAVGLLCCGLLAASCGLIGTGDSEGSTNRSDSAIGSSAADDDREDPGSEGTDPDERGSTGAAGSVWTRHDPPDFLPTGPKSDFRGALAAGDGGGWTVVGSVFDFETTQATAATWETTDPGSGSWTRTDVAANGDADETMIGVGRVGALEVAVGSRGEIGQLQPAVWSRTPGGPWVSFNSEQLVSRDSEYIHTLAVHEDGQAVMAVGVVESADGIMVPTLWLGDDGRSWVRSNGPRFATDGSHAVFGIAAGSDRWVMAGRRNLPDGTVVPAIWHSANGTSWEIVDLPLGNDRLGSANDIVWTGEQFVAVGQASSDLAAEPRSWVSTDGITWSEPSGDFTLNLEGRITSDGFGVGAVEAASGRLVATANLGFVQQIWESTNGRSWRPIDNIWELRTTGVGALALAVTGEEVLLATDDQALIHHRDSWQVSPVTDSVAPNPDETPFVNGAIAVDGGFVAVGAVQRSLPSEGTWQEGRTWFSPDGRSWTQVEPLDRGSLGPVLAAANVDGRAVAVGAQTLRDAANKDEPPRSMVWEGSGQEWASRQDELLVPPLNSRIHLQAATAVGADVILGGWFFPAEASAADPYLLSSADGGSFEVIDTGYRGVADETVVALCSDGVGTAVAFVRISDGSSRPTPFVRNSARQWSEGRADDGSFDDMPLVEVTSCGHSGGRFVAAGWRSEDRVGTDIALWESGDGASWSAVDGPPEFSATSDQWIVSMTVVDSGYLLAGADTSSGLTEPVVWYGDGQDWFAVPLGQEAVGMSVPTIAVHNGTVAVVGTVDGAPRSFTTTVEDLIAAAVG